MKIGSSHDGVLYGTRGLTVGAWRPETGFEPRGTLPNPDVPFTGKQQVNFGPLNRWWAKRLLSPATGWYTTTNVWPVDGDTLLATVGRCVYRSGDGGRSWRRVYDLPMASGPMGTLPTSFCEHDGRLYLAEYTFADVPARILVSEDDGRSWSTFFERPRYRHFHGVFHDPHADRLWATTGDTDAESAIGYFDDGEFREVGRGSQRWRAVGLTFTPDAILWGMDCSYSEAVRVFRLGREELRTDEPEPDIVHVVDSSVFYAETLAVGDERWVVVSTAAEVGLDDTAPSGSQNSCTRSARVLAASSRSNYEHWHEVYAFRRRRMLNEHLPKLPAASAYVFLAADDEVGVAVNPFNTTAHNGEILTITPERLAGAAGREAVGDAIDRRSLAPTRGVDREERPLDDRPIATEIAGEPDVAP